MVYAQVALDISTRALDCAFDYGVPEALESQAVVGATVLVSFGHRQAVGYIVSLSDRPSAKIRADHILPIQQVLVSSSFDEVAGQLALWIAKEYACPLSEALHPFLPPGQSVRVRKRTACPVDTAAHEKEDSPHTMWELVCEQAGPVDDRWVCLTEEGKSFVPSRRASRQRAIVSALAAGPSRMAELVATIPGASSVVSTLERRGIVAVESRRRVRGSAEQTTTLSSAIAHRPEHLTQGQEEALLAIREAIAAQRGDVVLVDGVTGSGKTEVYLAAIEHVLRQGKGAIVLVPEISLTAQTVGRFRSRFGDDVAVLHSRLSVGERFDQWDLIHRGDVHVVVGARSALFAPLTNVGLIVVDEEHEASYKQDSAPRYHAREVAAKLAQLRGAALVLGSATPSLESLERCQRPTYRDAVWRRVVMDERPGKAQLPTVKIADMTQEFAAGNRSIFSRDLRQALLDIEERREKAVLLLNRRGFATFLMCRECGCVPTCPHCSTSLAYHERTHALVCHTCGRSWPTRAWPDPSTSCPNCGSRYLGQFGVGTQRVEDELQALLGDDVSIIRMDADTTRTKGAHQRLLERFDASDCAVLIGTQMVAKGLDFPEVTLVGVVNADTTLKLPDFRAAERTYDLLEQVAGRAGRGDRPGRVIIQTYWASHPAIASVATHDRSTFLASELDSRREAYYPPFARLTNVVVWGLDAKKVRDAANEIATQARQEASHRDGWHVLGPAECARGRVKDRTRWHVLIKTPTNADPGPVLSACVSHLGSLAKHVRVAIDVDAYDLM